VAAPAEAFQTAPHLFGIPFIFNFPAVFIVFVITVVLVIGIKESAWFNNVMVMIKVAVVLLFLAVGIASSSSPCRHGPSRRSPLPWPVQRPSQPPQDRGSHLCKRPWDGAMWWRPPASSSIL
jgi:hypothetical protein